ncbi:MAG TPA: IS110 family transposase [Candidatus Limnocylindrales bacterium]|nr:IS110 family transposase [Candidatus Limnocylindrales bacterium]
MTTIGIDIGGRSHAVARCRDGLPRADREILRVSQSRAGFAALDAWLERQAAPVTLVTMESSGHYWMPIASHLRRRDVPVAVVNPLAAKYFAKSRLARTKSDPADARSLAEMGMRDQPVARDPLAGAELRQAARFAMTLVTEQAKVCQRLIRLVELGFPELGELFDDPTCRTAREVLRIAPTARAATRRRTTSLANANAGPGRRRLGQAKAERLQAAVADTIAVPELDAEVAFEVGLLLDQYDLLERQIAAADRRVGSLLDGETARRLRTIPGVGPSIAATLLAEIGDIDRFTDFDQLLAYAGIHPAERSSGRKGASSETAWHMSKAGNSHLRAAAYRLAVVGVQHNPIIAAHYARKRAAGKSKMNALGHCMRKALSLVWGVWRNGRDFDPHWDSRL